jgi:hypothetical protein
MVTKINRKDCITHFPKFPLRGYDYVNEEDVISYPKVYKSYILTFSSKTFKGHIRQLGDQLGKLIECLEFASLIFLGDTELSWLNQDNDYKPVKTAQEYLTNHKIGKRFNGGLKIDRNEIPIFIMHLGWLVRCNASLPYFHFLDEKQSILGNVCKYGNVHINSLSKSGNEQLITALEKSSFKYLDSNTCYNQFGSTSRIPGRRTTF